jgi:hypothetical protein
MGKESKERINESPMEKVEIFFSNLPESKYISQQHSIIPEGLWLGTKVVSIYQKEEIDMAKIH